MLKCPEKKKNNKAKNHNGPKTKLNFLNAKYNFLFFSFDLGWGEKTCYAVLNLKKIE